MFNKSFLFIGMV